MFVALISACGQSSDGGLSVEDIDTPFGIARKPDRVDAGSESASAGPLAEGSAEVATNVGPAQVAAGNEQGPVASAADAGLTAGDGGGVAPPLLDAGPAARTCRNLQAFSEKAAPQLREHCVRCHDGTKGKATKTLDLTSARDPSTAAQQRSCDQVLKSAPDDSEKSPIFAEVNPEDPSTVHDFKFPSSASYEAYRAAVLAWLESE